MSAYFSLPFNGENYTPEELREYALAAFNHSRNNSFVPAPAQTTVSIVNNTIQTSTQQPDVRLTQQPDVRLSGILAAQQGLLALALADALTHVIKEQP